MKDNIDLSSLDPAILKNLQSFRGSSILKKAAMNLLVKMLSARQLSALKDQFYAIDTDHSGFIDVSELTTAIKEAELPIPESEIKKLIAEVDYHGNKQINYSEFIAATLTTK